MLEPYEQKTIIQYIQNIMNAPSLSVTQLCVMCDSFDTLLPYLGIIDEYDNEFELFDKFTRATNRKEGARKMFLSVRTAMLQIIAKRKKEVCNAQPGRLAGNIIELSAELRLGLHEKTLLGLFLRYEIHEPINSLLNSLTQQNMGVVEVCSICLDMDRNHFRKLLRQDERLLASGVIVPQSTNGKDLNDQFEVSYLLLSAINRSFSSHDNLLQYLLGTPIEASLDWHDYDHLAEARDRLGLFISHAVKQQLQGVNILLYGPGGTGKTEFCKTLAAHLNFNLYSLTEQDEKGNEPSRQERMSGFQLSQNLLRYQENSLLLFDEMDDLFEDKGLTAIFGGTYSSGSKVFMNRLLENNPVPTIWTINNPRMLDETIIRRMSLAIEMKIPSLETRQRVWKRQLAKQDVQLPEDELRKLAQSEVAPGVVSNAVRFAKLSGGTLADYQFATHSIVKAMKGGKALKHDQEAEIFKAKLVVADCDLHNLTDRIIENKRRDFSFCLYGPSGTGKSAYLRYLAKRLDMPVLIKRTSDLLSKWVGGSEENIANAFEEARANESFLIFDEADSLLGDRRNARASWEISQVNEMLTWMEDHPLPFACTTNLIKYLDQAAMRRFTFKSHFDYLGKEEVRLAFKHFFKLSLEPEWANKLRLVTPGDFAVVKKKAEFWGLEGNIYRLIELLQQEVNVKNEKIKVTIGFKHNLECKKIIK